MALVPQTTSVNVLLYDNNGLSADTTLFFAPTVNIGTLVTNATAVTALVAALSNANIRRVTVSYTLVEDNPVLPPPEAEVERKLYLIGRTAQGSIARISIPSPTFAIESSGTNRVDLSRPAVAALVTAITQGFPVIGVGGTNYIGQDIRVIERAFVSHRRRKVQ